MVPMNDAGYRPDIIVQCISTRKKTDSLGAVLCGGAIVEANAEGLDEVDQVILEVDGNKSSSKYWASVVS